MRSGPVDYFQALNTTEVFRVVRDERHFECDRMRCYQGIELADWHALLGQLACEMTEVCCANFVERHDFDILYKRIDQLVELR